MYLLPKSPPIQKKITFARFRIVKKRHFWTKKTIFFSKHRMKTCGSILDFSQKLWNQRISYRELEIIPIFSRNYVFSINLNSRIEKRILTFEILYFWILFNDWSWWYETRLFMTMSWCRKQGHTVAILSENGPKRWFRSLHKNHEK